MKPGLSSSLHNSRIPSGRTSLDQCSRWGSRLWFDRSLDSEELFAKAMTDAGRASVKRVRSPPAGVKSAHRPSLACSLPPSVGLCPGEFELLGEGLPLRGIGAASGARRWASAELDRGAADSGLAGAVDAVSAARCSSLVWGHRRCWSHSHVPRSSPRNTRCPVRSSPWRLPSVWKTSRRTSARPQLAFHSASARTRHTLTQPVHHAGGILLLVPCTAKRACGIRAAFSRSVPPAR